MLAQKVRDVCNVAIQDDIHDLAGEVCAHLAEIADNEDRLSDVTPIAIHIYLSLAPRLFGNL
jgi:hypothetical protein